MSGRLRPEESGFWYWLDRIGHALRLPRCLMGWACDRYDRTLFDFEEAE